jgi:hypothetical protein
MLPWIKRWRDWAMHDLWPMHRIGLPPQALHYGFEKAGLTLYDQPIPWSAEAVLVEASVRLAASTPRRKADFQLRLPGQEPLPPESLRRQEGEDLHRVLFRLPTPAANVTADLVWRSHVLGQITLPVLSREEFLQKLRVQMPTLFVRLGDESVACQTFVSSQCKGILVSALVASPTSLVPLLDMDLQVEFRPARGTAGYRVPARLCSSQLAGRQALITVAPRKFPRRIGAWVANWLLGDRVLVTQQIKAISQRTFQRSLRLSDTRYVFQTKKGDINLARHVPPLEGLARLGPCFLLCSREAGMAGLCQVRVHAQVSGAVQPPLLLEQEVLITDGPTMVAPGTLDVSDVGQVSGFDVSVKGHSLGALPLRPAPTASFTSEGGFKTPHDFSWSTAAEEELNERLTRLLENRPNGG